MEHLQHTNDNRILKASLNYRPRGQINVGCPRKRWIDWCS